MSLATQIQSLATRAGSEDRSLRTLLNGNASDLAGLNTTNKSNFVVALNEVLAGFDDVQGSTDLGVANRTSTALDVTSSTGGAATLPVATTTFAGLMSSSMLSKLDGVASGATKNRSDSFLLSRANHTGQQAISTVDGLQVALDAKVSASQKGAADGVATLNSSGKVPESQLPASVLGGLQYQGTWDAAANSPSLSDGTGTKGHYYVVSTAGSTTLDGTDDWRQKDWVVFDGSTWSKVDNTDSVTSVNGGTGAVTGLLEASANLSDLDSAATARSNLDVYGTSDVGDVNVDLVAAFESALA